MDRWTNLSTLERVSTVLDDESSCLFLRGAGMRRDVRASVAMTLQEVDEMGINRIPGLPFKTAPHQPPQSKQLSRERR